MSISSLFLTLRVFENLYIFHVMVLLKRGKNERVSASALEGYISVSAGIGGPKLEPIKKIGHNLKN